MPVTAGGTIRQSTLWFGSCGRPGCRRSASVPTASGPRCAEARRIVPPFVSSESATTAIPCVEWFGSTTS